MARRHSRELGLNLVNGEKGNDVTGTDDMTGTARGRGAARHRPRLRWAFILVVSYLLVELVTAWISGSLALLSDALHMLTDAAALGMALAATRLAERKDTSGQRTYGYYRAEVLAALAVSLLMVGTGIVIVIAAIRRIGADVEIAAGPMLIVAVVGLVVNLICVLLLKEGSTESINVRAAYQEVLVDAVGSLAVLAGGAVIWFTELAWVDTVVAFGIGAFIAPRAYRLGRDAIRVLLQDAPVGIDVTAVTADLRALPGVDAVHDVHVWSLTSGMDVATAHLVVADDADAHEVLDAARDKLVSSHKIAHATLQVEPRDHVGCDKLDW